MDYQPIVDIAALCVRKQVNQVVMCPGSRCAPLTLAFTRHKGIKSRTFSDERSAGFVALGIAQQTRRPAVLLCTSGTAAYNFAPAVAEAYFSNTPLIVFTADRPGEWIGQLDGQTIYQGQIYGQHVKKSFTLPVDYDHSDSRWLINRTVNEAINLARQHPMGPVHINAPFREPLYPPSGSGTSYSEDLRVIEEHAAVQTLGETDIAFITQQWTQFANVLVVAGQNDSDPETIKALEALSVNHGIPIAGDIISNVHACQGAVLHTDLFLGQASDKVKASLQPELLITFGKSLVSKNLKLFLRKYQPVQHWHIQEAGIAADTFKNVTNVFHSTPAMFLQLLAELKQGRTTERKQYKELWQHEEHQSTEALKHFSAGVLSEIEVVAEVLRLLPSQSGLHLANSMSVRYANFIGLQARQNYVRVYSNRGTSGIDGCTSTAVGHAFESEAMHVLITGDVAFFYDRNAFWHNYHTPNLRILLLNNHGGLIFNMIDGPASQPEAPEYFITRQQLSARHLCEEFGFEYLRLDNHANTSNLVKSFLNGTGGTKVLEVESDIHINRQVFDQLKQSIKKNYDV